MAGALEGLVVTILAETSDVRELAGTRLVAQEVGAVADRPPARLVRGGSPIPVATRLVVVPAHVTASEALEVGKCTAGVVDVVVFAFDSLASVQLGLEMGSDRENWSGVSSTLFTRIGFARFRFRGIPARYLRLYFQAFGSPGGMAILTTSVTGGAN